MYLAIGLDFTDHIYLKSDYQEVFYNVIMWLNALAQ